MENPTPHSQRELPHHWLMALGLLAVVAHLPALGGYFAQDDWSFLAKAAGKLSRDYEIPAGSRRNTPERLRAALAPHRERGHFPPFPFGTDLTAEEQHIGRALRGLEQASSGPLGKLRLARHLWPQARPTASERGYLRRMALDEPRGISERLYARMLLVALRLHDS